MRSENMAKNCLNAVRLPKFQPVNSKSWSPRKMMVKNLRQRSGRAWFCARAESCVVFNTGTYSVLPDNSIYLYRSAKKVIQWRGKSGSGISNMWEKLVATHRSRDTTHAQWLQTHCQWYPMGDVRTYNSRMDSRSFKLGGGINQVTRHVWALTKVKRSEVKVTRSRNVSAAITL